jgi:hypothetical protein
MVNTLRLVLGRAMENHIKKEQFLLEFFGSFGRDLGNPARWFTDNPNDIFSFIEECAQNKAPRIYQRSTRERQGPTLRYRKGVF